MKTIRVVVHALPSVVLFEPQHVCWYLSVDDSCCYEGCVRYESCILWRVIFLLSQLWAVSYSKITWSCIKASSHRLKAELFLSHTVAAYSCTCWQWCCVLLYMLAMIVCALVHAGCDTVFFSTCCPWFAALLYVLAMILCALVHASHYTFLPLYVLVTIPCALVHVGHDTECSCTCWPWYGMPLCMLAMLLCAFIYSGHDPVCLCTCWPFYYVHWSWYYCTCTCWPWSCVLLYTSQDHSVNSYCCEDVKVDELCIAGWTLNGLQSRPECSFFPHV